jgi:hypothetical protein
MSDRQKNTPIIEYSFQGLAGKLLLFISLMDELGENNYYLEAANY